MPRCALRAALALLLGASLGACTGARDGGHQPRPTTTRPSLEQQVRADLGSLHQSKITEVPNLLALFYHHPDGWAVEDTSLDAGETWCRHAYYSWELEEVVALDDFIVRYTPANEPADCTPLGISLVLHVTGREMIDGRLTLTGEYVGTGLHATRTVCLGSIDDFAEVCGESSNLGEPTEQP